MPGQRCSHEVRAGARFCVTCGRPIAEEDKKPAAPPAAQGVSDGGVGRRRFRWPLVLVPVLVLAGGGAAAAALLVHSSHRTGAVTSANGESQHTAGDSPAGTPSSALPPEQAAAKSLAALLAQSVTDRSSVVNAVNDVNNCGPSLNQDSTTFASAATSRQDLLSRLAALPDRSSLPQPMLQALIHAWQASAQADQDFGQWVQDEVSQGCTQNDHADPNYQDAAGPDSLATIDKKAFVAAWNPIAAQYALSAYQWDQL
jgi:hypothetical protein